ncbi:MAG: hypothetical protein U0872_14475 [Planctomycetaceae bacterium]
MSADRGLCRVRILDSGELIHELLATETEYRRWQRQAIDWADYQERFPDAVRGAHLEALRLLESSGQTFVASERESAVIAGSTEEVVRDGPWDTSLDLRDFELGQRLGGGGQGDVFLAIQRVSWPPGGRIKFLRQPTPKKTLPR